MINGNSFHTTDDATIRAQNTEDTIYFNFSYAALKLLGKNLYSNAANAISELVANSIDAKAHNIYVYIDMSDKAHSIIEILDDGSGMDEKTLAKLNHKLANVSSYGEKNHEDEKAGGIALQNVNNRIHLIYGEEYGIHIYSIPEKGTDVEISIPINQQG